MLRRLIGTLFAWLFLSYGVALAQPLTATVSGTVYSGSGKPAPNVTVIFNTPQQVVAASVVSQSIVSTRTNSAGAITPITLVQNAVVQVTVGAGMVITGIVPGSSAVDINQVLAGTVITLPAVEVNGVALSSVINVNFEDGAGIAVTNPSGANIQFTFTPSTLSAGAHAFLGNNTGGTAAPTFVQPNFTDLAGTATFAQTPLGAPASDDQVFISSSASAGAWKSIADCQDTSGKHLNYTASTNAISCGTTASVAGTVTSVAQSFTGGLISVAGTPITSSGTLALTVAGTSGGIPYFSGATTWASSGALTANLPVIGGGAGVAPSVGTRSGNTTAYVTTTGTQTASRSVVIDASGNHIAGTNSRESNGHVEYNGTTPAVSNTSAASCGTTAATIAGNDMVGKVTVGATGGTSCTVTFATTWANAPSCVVTNESTANLSRATSTATTAILAGTFAGGDVLAYNCAGRF